MSFQKESMQQDELQLAYLHQLDQDTSLSFSCFSLFRCSKSTLESFNQLDLEISLSFPQLGSISVSYQLQADSFHRISFELTASLCAALLQTISQSFQLTGFQLSSALVSGGVQQKASHKLIGQQAWPTRPFSTASTLKSLSLATWLNTSKRALRRRTLSALTLHSLSLALSAWLKTPSKIAWRDIASRQSFFTTSSSTTSSHRSASMRALQTTSFRRLASASALTTTNSFRTTSSFPATLSCVSFLFTNFFCNNSFARKKIEKKDELSKTVLELELEEPLANKTCSLGPYDHLEQKLWQIQLQELSLQQNNQEQQNQLSATVPDRELLQLHLSQLCQQDPDSAISRQLPKEPLSASGLRTAAWPAAVQIDNLSFSKQNLSEQDLSNISLDKFFPENFGKQLSEQQLQKKLYLSAAQLGTPQLHREDLAQGACNNLCQEQLQRQPCLAELLLCHLGFAEGSFRAAWRQQPLQAATCREQLHPDRRRSLQRTASHNWLFRSQLEPAAFQQKLGSAQWGQSSFTTRTSSKRASRRRACRQDLCPEHLGSNQLANKNFNKTASEEPA